MQVQVFEEKPDSSIAVDLAVCDDHVAIAPCDPDSMQRIADHKTRNGRLHQAFKFQADRRLVFANDL